MIPVYVVVYVVAFVEAPGSPAGRSHRSFLRRGNAPAQELLNGDAVVFQRVQSVAPKWMQMDWFKRKSTGNMVKHPGLRD